MGKNEDLEAKMIMTEMDLEDSRKFNKLAAGLIIILLIIMSAMLLNLKRLANEYKELVVRYEVLQEDLRGGELQ